MSAAERILLEAPGTHGPTDDELHAAWVSGDDAAFRALIDRHGSSVLRFLQTLVGGAADDAWSETWLRVIRARDRYEPGGTWRAWVLTIARRCALDQKRGARRMLRLRAAAKVEPTPPPRASPERCLRLVRRGDRLSEAIATLDADQQAILRLTYADDLNSAEVGRVLGLTAQQVRNKLTYARKLLRERLEDER